MSILESIRELFIPQSPPNEALHEKRARVRIKCSFTVMCRGMEEEMAGKIYEMGQEGLRVEVPRRVKPGDRYALELKQLSASSSPFDFEEPIVWGQVIWCRKKRFASTMLAGFSYLDSGDKLDRSWVRHIFRKLGVDPQGIFQKRTYIRADADMPVSYAQGSMAPEEGRLLNIGIGGALIETRLPVSLRNEIMFSLGPHQGIPRVSCKGVVLQARMDSGGRRWNVGIMFGDLTAHQTRILGRYVMKFLRE
jgi:hypothetical protein